MSLISVITSTYKRPKRVKKAIESVLAQTFTDWELIVVDDCSKDQTKAVVGHYSDPRIRYVERKKNFGCDTRPKNEGILASKGEYIAFLDDDNAYRPDHLAVLVKAIQKENVDLVYGDRWIIDEEGRIPSQLGFTMDFDPPTLMSRNFIDTSDVLVKRQALFDVGGFDETIKKYIDWNIYVRMLKWGHSFKHVPIVITDYFLHRDMKSERVKTKHDVPGKFVPEWNALECDVVLPYLGKMIVPPKIAVYSITYDRVAYTKKSFESLHQTAGYPFDHFVVDNGSTDETKEYLTREHANRRIKRIKLNTINEGISKASNDAISMIKQEGQYDIFLKWDNDCIGLTKGWLAKMVEIWRCNRKAALSCYVQGLVDNPGGSPRLGYGTLKGELLGITNHLGGICHFVDARAYDNFQWDDHSFLHGVQDMEFSQHLFYNKYLQAYLENYYVSHGPQGTAKQKEEYKDYFERRVLEKRTRYETS